MYWLADLTVSKWPGTSCRIEIHFPVFNHALISFDFLYKTCLNLVIMFSLVNTIIIFYQKFSGKSKLYFMRNFEQFGSKRFYLTNSASKFLSFQIT